ncbi:MAG TPA: SDR family NAD(P)-dependent oxidoreductase [Actinopolymorphaceae bacterium]
MTVERPVLVTGGASGLGQATTSALRAKGFPVWVLDIQQPTEPVEVFEKVDVADTAAAHETISRLVDDHGDLGGVFTAAGTDSCGPLDEIPRQAWENVIGVNLLGTAAVVRAALPSLRRTHGRIVTCASTLGVRVAADASAYCASKFGVVGFTRALTEELKGEVGVTLLVPGGMHTAFFDGRSERYKPAADAALLDPGHVANAVVLALSQPAGCEIRELVITSSEEVSWP